MQWLRIVGLPVLVGLSGCVSGPTTTARPRGDWVVAAFGSYRGHRWVRYRADGVNGGKCLSVEVDGEPDTALRSLLPVSTTAPLPGTLVAPPLADPRSQLGSGVYKGHVASCSTGLMPPVVIGPAIAPSATEPGELSGLVRSGVVSVRINLSNRPTVATPVVDGSFTAFIEPGAIVSSVTATDAAGRIAATCNVSVVGLNEDAGVGSSFIEDC